jgi:OOP family OmpA-OmpF porin
MDIRIRTAAALIPLSVAAALFTANASAADGFTVGLDAAHARTRGNDGDPALSDNSFGVRVGYDIDTHFGVELAYRDLGEDTVSDDFGDRAKIKAHSIGLSALGKLPLNDQFTLFGRLGYASTRYEIKVRATEFAPGDDFTEHDRIKGFEFGAGAEYSFAPDWAARVEYIRLEKADADIYSLGLTYRF